MALLAPALIGGPGATPVAAAAPTSFTFNWVGAAPAAQPWVPAAANDWDVMLSNGVTGEDDIRSGNFQGGHGADCGAPPATHTISKLTDTVYICNNHMMTAANDTNVFFTPNQLVDFSHGTSTVTFQVSTQRLSTRDWWEMWLSPYNENFVTPTDDAPTFNGNPRDAIHIVMDQRGGCSIGQPTWEASNGSHTGTMFLYYMYKGGQEVVSKGGGDGGCMEDVAGGPSAKTRSTFELDVSSGHLRFLMHGPNGDAKWIDDNVQLPFNQAVVTWGHRSYNPSKACGFDGTCGPNTFHWSNFSISPSVGFTMLRPIGVNSIHAGTNMSVTLPQPAPANSFLRFSAFGSPKVSFDHGAAVTPNRQDTAFRPEGSSSYFTPVPAGTKTITFSGSTRGGQNLWIEDVAVWASTTPVTLPGQQPTPTAAPTAAPTPVTTPVPTPVVSPPAHTPGPVASPPSNDHHGRVDRWRMVWLAFQAWWRAHH